MAAAVLAVFAVSVRLEPTPDSAMVLKSRGVTCAGCCPRKQENRTRGN
jgi:hypothetical protein